MKSDYYFSGGNKITITSVHYHRNGVGGIGFHSVTFGWRDDDRKARRMVASVWSEEQHGGDGYYSVLDATEADAGNVFSAWRGDHFERALRAAIADWDADQTRNIKRLYAERILLGEVR